MHSTVPSSRTGLRSGAAERRQLIRRGLTIAGLALFVLVLLLAVPGLRDVLTEIRGMDPAWIAGAVVLEIMSCVSYTVIVAGFFPQVRSSVAHRVAWTEMGTSSVVPGGGVGGLALGGWLLHQAGVRKQAVIEGSSGVFFLTSAASVALLGMAGLLLLTGAPGPDGLLRAALPVLASASVLTGAIALVRRSRDSGRLPNRVWLGGVARGIDLAYRACVHPDRRVAGAAGYLLFDIAVLWATFGALGVHPALTTIVLGYLVGGLGNLIPIPGGIGALDTSMAAALVLFGAPATAAIAAVLVYHAILFWTSGLGGLLASLGLRRQIAGQPDPVRLATPLVVRPASSVKT